MFHCIMHALPIVGCCCLMCLLQEFNARGLRHALALALIVRQPFPGLAAVCEDPSRVAPL